MGLNKVEAWEASDKTLHATKREACEHNARIVLRDVWGASAHVTTSHAFADMVLDHSDCILDALIPLRLSKVEG